MVQTAQFILHGLYARNDLLISQIRELFPKNPFILILGTSHTHGSCTVGDQKLLSDDERWTGIVKNNIDLDVMNLAIPGITNHEMVQVLIDCFDFQLLSNCKLVIAETRTGTGQSSFTYDAFSNIDFENDYEIDEKFWNPYVSGGSDIGLDTFMSKVKGKFAGGKVSKPGYYEGLLTAVYDNPPPQAVKDLQMYLEMRGRVYHYSHESVLDDLDAIRTMHILCKNAGVDFKWFTWPAFSQYSDKLTPNLRDYYLTFTQVFNTCLFPEVGLENALKNIMDQHQDKWYCECMHWTAFANQHVAKFLIEKIKECLNK